MKRLLQIVSTLSLFLLHQCGQPKTPFDKSQSTAFASKQYVDTNIYSILPYDTSSYWIFKKATSTNLSQVEIIDVENILKMCINEYNIEQQKQFDTISKAHPDYDLSKQNFVIDLTRYKRQYFPVINDKGEKEVWINCFCDTTNKDWKNNLVFVFDGGNCYFNLIINLTKKSYYQLMVNGDA